MEDVKLGKDEVYITANGPYEGRIGKVVMIYYDIEHTGSSDDLLYEEGENAC